MGTTGSETNREDVALCVKRQAVVDNRALVKRKQKKSEGVTGNPKLDDGESSGTVKVLLLTLWLSKIKADRTHQRMVPPPTLIAQHKKVYIARKCNASVLRCMAKDPMVHDGPRSTSSYNEAFRKVYISPTTSPTSSNQLTFDACA